MTSFYIVLWVPLKKDTKMTLKLYVKNKLTTRQTTIHITQHRALKTGQPEPRQTTIHKTQHRALKTEQPEQRQKLLVI